MPGYMRLPRPLHPTLPLAALLCAALAGAPARGAESPRQPDLRFCPEDAARLLADAASRRRPVDPRTPIEISSDDARVDVAGNAQVAGRVVLRQGDRQLSADDVRVDTNSNSVDVNGNVRYEDPELRVEGRAGHYAGNAAQFSDAEFQMLQQPSRGRAGALKLRPDGTLELDDVFYTTCPPDSVDWQIDARSVQLDSTHQTGVARNARVRFKDVTLFYLPWISFPAGPARKSGFLFPSLGSSSRGGVQLSAPYYLNLAPNYDATIEPTLFSRRGVDVFSELRVLTARSQGSLDANLLPHDGVFGAARSRLKVSDVTELPGDWRLRLGAENVSDAAYFEDFAQGADKTSIAFLPRALELSYRNDVWRSGAVLRNFQTIDRGLALVDRPYTELPRLYASALWRGGTLAVPFEYGFDSEAVDFRRSAGVQGWRADVMPHAQLSVEGPGYFLRPAVAFRSTAYSLTGTAPGADSSPQRSLPIASLDTGLLFEREAGSNGRRRITLEPRLMYLYVPYRRQDMLPVFDTGLPDLNWVELFRTNRYVGADRMGDANQLSAGVTSRLFASDSGTRYLSATLGQTYYFEQPRVLLPNETPQGRRASDLIARAELKAFENWSVDLGLQWDPHQDQAQKSEVRVQYRPEGSKVVNLGYRFQRDQLEQADVSAAWPLARNWNLYGRMLYSLKDHSAIDQFAGFEYSSCCWGIRAVARNYVVDRGGRRDTGVFVQLELKGLSSVGTAANAFLERAIRGYSPSGRNR
jgi:LPS-assembly protein